MSKVKTTTIYCLVIEAVTHSTFQDTLEHQKQLLQQICAAAELFCSSMVQLRVASEKEEETGSENT